MFTDTGMPSKHALPKYANNLLVIVKEVTLTQYDTI